MITFRCTQKARKVLGLRDRDLSDETDDDLAEWFVDASTVDHRRCLLFTHKLTLYSFWVTGVRRADTGTFGQLFKENLVRTLRRDGFHEQEFQRLLREGHRFAKTNDRSVLGSMNNHVLCSRWYFQNDGGLGRADVAEINSRLNRTPMGALCSRPAHGFPDQRPRKDRATPRRRINDRTLRRARQFLGGMRSPLAPAGVPGALAATARLSAKTREGREGDTC